MSDQAPAPRPRPSAGIQQVTMTTIPRNADGSAVDPRQLMQPREAAGAIPPPEAAAAPAAPAADPGMVAAVANAMRGPRAAPAPRQPLPPAPAAEPVATPVAEPQPALAGDIPEVPPDPKAGQANFTWADLRSRAKAAEAAAQAAEAAAAAKALEAQKNAEALAKLKAERDELSDRMEKTDLLNSPAFKERYENKIDQARQELVAGLSQITETPEQADALAKKLLTAPANEFVEVLNKLPQVFQTVAFSARTTVANTVKAREAAVADWKSTRAALQEQEATNQRIQMATNAERGVAAAVERALQNGNYLLQRTGNPEADASAEAIVAHAKMTLTQPRTQQDVVDLVVEGASAPHLRQHLSIAQQRIQQLEAQLRAAGSVPAAAVRPAPAPAPSAPPPATRPAPVNARRPSLIRDTIGGLLQQR